MNRRIRVAEAAGEAGWESARTARPIDEVFSLSTPIEIALLCRL